MQSVSINPVFPHELISLPCYSIEALQDYLDSMERADSDSEGEEEDLNNIESQMQQLAATESPQTDHIASEKEELTEDEEETGSSSKTEMESDSDKVHYSQILLIYH